MPLILGANSLAGGYQIKNSARFNSGSSDYLNRTFTTPTNRKIFTFSTWLKKTKNGDYFNLFSANHSTTNAQNWLGFSTASYDDLYFNEFDGSSYNFRITTTQLFRDVSAFYHLVVAVDTTQATASNRIKIYVNGTQVTSFVHETYPSQNYEMKMNSAVNHAIGTGLYNGSQSYFLNAYVTETYFIDGQSLTPSSFGETDTDTGIWKPKAYTGTYGTNGFYLDFEDSANLGNDMSGNNNDFTVNNLTSIDQTTDTPTNNFCTWNPLDINNPSYVNTLTEGNLKAGNPNGDSTGYFFTTFANFSPSQGKWYWEVKADSLTTTLGLGIYFGQNTFTTSYPFDAYVFYCLQNGSAYYNGSVYSYMDSYTSNDILTFALDMDNKKLYIGKNGSWANGSGSTNQTFANAVSITTVTASFPTGRDVFPILVSKNTYGLANFGNPPYSSNSYTDGAGYGNFSYAVPSGFYSLNTKNLAQYG